MGPIGFYSYNFLTYQSVWNYVIQVLKERYPDEPSRDTVSAEDMSEFYKAHLNARWRDHLDYNIEWQRRNFREGFVCDSVLVG